MVDAQSLCRRSRRCSCRSPSPPARVLLVVLTDPQFAQRRLRAMRRRHRPRCRPRRSLVDDRLARSRRRGSDRSCRSRRRTWAAFERMLAAAGYHSPWPATLFAALQFGAAAAVVHRVRRHTFGTGRRRADLRRRWPRCSATSRPTCGWAAPSNAPQPEIQQRPPRCHRPAHRLHRVRFRHRSGARTASPRNWRSPIRRSPRELRPDHRRDARRQAAPRGVQELRRRAPRSTTCGRWWRC